MIRASKARVRRTRDARGAQISEFGAALSVLLFAVILFVNVVVLPVRWYMARELMLGYVQKLALCETYSEALSILASTPSLEDQMNTNIGVKAKQIRCAINVSDRNEKNFAVDKPGSMPLVWLPDGPNGPYIYSLQLSADVEIAPLFALQYNPKIPGLTGPVRIPISLETNWEHLGRDPHTKAFFVNE